MTAKDSKRLAEIRATYYGGVYGNSPGAVDVPWLLDQIAARDEEIEQLRQVAAGNDERTQLLAKKYSGEAYDELRLAALMELTRTAFNRSEDILRFQMAERDARIEKMESALKTIRANTYDREVLGYCDAGCGQVAEDALE